MYLLAKRPKTHQKQVFFYHFQAPSLSFKSSAPTQLDVRRQSARLGIGQTKHPAHALNGFFNNCEPQARAGSSCAGCVTPKKRAG